LDEARTFGDLIQYSLDDHYGTLYLKMHATYNWFRLAVHNYK
jgi:hypothetical protein